MIAIVQFQWLSSLPRQSAVEDTQDYDLAHTHSTHMLRKMLVLNKPEETLCHCFCCALAQDHVMRRSLMAVIVFFQLHLQWQFNHVLCNITCAFVSVVWVCTIVAAVAGMLWTSADAFVTIFYLLGIVVDVAHVFRVL
jgi:hypothetical protein